MRVLDVNMGFSPDRVSLVRIDPNSSYKTPEKVNAYFTEVLRRVNEIQGVESAGMSDAIPLGHNRSWGIGVKGVQYKPNEYPEGFPRIISEGYFHAIGVPLKKGRDFSARDDKGTLNVIILNETCCAESVSERGSDRKDHRRRCGSHGCRRRRRRASHVARRRFGQRVLHSAATDSATGDRLILWCDRRCPTSELGARLREALLPLEPNLPTSNMRTMQSMVDRAVSPRRFVVILLGGFAAFALVLASLGIYAVISYSVSQRTQEIGIRMALGASSEMLQKSILMQTLWLAAIGVVGGIIGSWILARALSGMLFGVTPTDPITFAVMVLILTGVACLAGYLPARRASHIDPMQALRVD